jgi:hypothetical protein
MRPREKRVIRRAPPRGLQPSPLDRARSNRPGCLTSIYSPRLPPSARAAGVRAGRRYGGLWSEGGRAGGRAFPGRRLIWAWAVGRRLRSLLGCAAVRLIAPCGTTHPDASPRSIARPADGACGRSGAQSRVRRGVTVPGVASSRRLRTACDGREPRVTDASREESPCVGASTWWTSGSTVAAARCPGRASVHARR